MTKQNKIALSVALIVSLASWFAMLVSRHERGNAEPDQVIAQDESHPHPHPLRFRSPDELRAWRVYVVSALGGRYFWITYDWMLDDVIYAADRLIRAERDRKPILKPKPKPRKEDTL